MRNNGLGAVDLGKVFHTTRHHGNHLWDELSAAVDFLLPIGVLSALIKDEACLVDGMAFCNNFGHYFHVMRRRRSSLRSIPPDGNEPTPLSGGFSFLEA